MERNDVLLRAKSPSHVVKLLVSIGGKNPYGEPNFRLSIAEGVMKQAGAEWFKWRNGSPARMNGTLLVDVEGNTVRPPAEQPISIDVEVRWTRKYPALRGWILEEWQPAHLLGTPEEWAEQTVPGHPNCQSLGPYPEEGRYMLALPYGWKQPDAQHTNDPRFKGHAGLPADSTLIIALDYVLRCRDFWGEMTPATRRMVMNDADLAQAALKERYDYDRAGNIAREVAGVLVSNSLEAGRIRTKWADDAGLKIGHVGS